MIGFLVQDLLSADKLTLLSEQNFLPHESFAQAEHRALIASETTLVYRGGARTGSGISRL